ncbi:D-aminoacylase [Alicyclobacillus curvatus]|nr:D-aminoacylase [Alicyclobacillus curvatus]
MFDVVVRNGRLIDGTGNPWTYLDVGVKDGHIAVIGHLKNADAAMVIDAKGQVVAPGFIDPHVHSDLLCLHPEVHKVKVMQGITTELLGQDGISVAPVSERTKPLWQQQLKSLNGDIGDWPWNSVEDYLHHLSSSNLNGNAAYLVPHGAVRTLVMGFAARTCTQTEAKEMRGLVEQAMEQGAMGLSSGLIYPPNLYSDLEELTELCKGAAKYHGCFVVHIRNESNHMLAAVDEMIEVARRSGVRLHLSHFKVGGQANRANYAIALKKLEDARAEGIEITFDQYPYTAGSTVFHSLLPPWMHDGGSAQMLENLRDVGVQNRIKKAWREDDAYENWVRNCGWENIVITAVGSAQNRSIEGLNMLQVAKSRHQEPEDAAIDLLLEEAANITMITHWGFEEDIISAMQHPLQMVGSDSIFGGKPHPRLYGTYPRVLGRFTRELKALKLEDAIRRMTGAPAQLLRLHDRGLLKEGYFADVVVFDADTVADRATYDNPMAESVGISHVLVNGQTVVQGGTYTGCTPGQVIYRRA